MSLLTTMNLLSRLHHGQGLTVEELKRLQTGLLEQISYVNELVATYGRDKK